MAITLLDDLRLDPAEQPLATKGKRLANYVIDLLAIYSLILLGMSFMCKEAGAPNPWPASVYTPEPPPSIIELLLKMLSPYLILVMYYVVLEYVLGGKTVGKLITRTRALTVEQQRMTLGMVVKRSLTRIVPFEAFSFLGDKAEGWHDKWSNTIVVDEQV